MDLETSELATQFATAIGRTSYDWIHSRMEQAKLLKKSDEQQAVYQEIITKLMNDKAELELIAGQYKSMYEKVNISDNDIEHLQSTLESFVTILEKYELVPETDKDDIKMVIDLFNKDTLKTAQLLGFNYRNAIGKPLTEWLSYTISKNIENDKNVKRLEFEYAKNYREAEIDYIKENPESYFNNLREEDKNN